MLSPDHLAVLLTPVLLGLMLAEAALAHLLGRQVHGARQTLNNVAMAVAQRVVASATGLAPLLGYPWLQSHVGLLEWSPGSVWQWAAAFLLVDLAIYLRHRAAHRVGLLWAMHAVHHQSLEYNFTVATRLSWLQEGILWAVPLAVLGVPVEMVLPLFVFHNLYQFLQHTELVGRLGIVDRVLMTPSNHRVHHACNAEYLDKNYGSFLVVWDRLFGTWAPEAAPVVYGTLDGLPTYDVVDNSVAPFAHLWAKMRRAPTPWQATRCLWMPPAWEPGVGEVAPDAVPTDPTPQRAAAPSRRARAVAWSLVTAALAGALTVTWFASGWTLGACLVGAALVFAALAVAGVALDGRRVERVAGPVAQLAVVLQTLAGQGRGPVWYAGRWVGAAARADQQPYEGGIGRSGVGATVSGSTGPSTLSSS